MRSAPGRTPDRTSLSAPRAERRRARTLLESESDDLSRARAFAFARSTPHLAVRDGGRAGSPLQISLGTRRWATTRSSRS